MKELFPLLKYLKCQWIFLDIISTGGQVLRLQETILHFSGLLIAWIDCLVYNFDSELKWWQDRNARVVFDAIFLKKCISEGSIYYLLGDKRLSCIRNLPIDWSSPKILSLIHKIKQRKYRIKPHVKNNLTFSIPGMI